MSEWNQKASDHSPEIAPPVPCAGGSGDVPLLPDAEWAILPLPSYLAAWILWMMAQSLSNPWRGGKLSEDEAWGFAAFLHDCLPPSLRTPLPKRAVTRRRRR